MYIKKRNPSVRRILLLLSTLFILSTPALAKGKERRNAGGYWRDTTTYVTEYTIPASYSDDGRFTDVEGYEWYPDFVAEKKSSHYTLYMSDNGTPETRTDDLVLAIY